ncbi:glycosyltransferase family 39 protein [Synechococcus sp. Tobar12-5m-g]|uniref:glycosyltransferase family 39 protein n=1 Tax=unclassified Synechococcus TaxID=2626047 RepID=UPI0020CC66C8|nr:MULTISPECIES: glycosyltransferase family 39 protein [unclassified Synechococcus]MCP9772211.1 glycosyltransferase family 39 protein [Synechococcus sp. Tobar12-5m-g]MCP9873118.1 glycosyltransferase family 39 protein [Synechococcus sp. Cruz CV-v-12]
MTEAPPSWRPRLRPELLLPLVLLGGLVVRLVLAMVLPPGYDEAYYLFYGRHLALSYFDHPAAVGLWAWVGTRLGGSILALRLPSLLSYTLALALLSGATERWFGRRAALLSAVLGSVAPVLFLCGGLLLLPDSPLLLALAALLWWLSRHPRVVPASPRQAIALGVLLGLVTLGKYHALLVLVSLLAWCLVSKQRRRHFRSPWPGLALLVWLLVSAPLWLWNLNNGWASFLFQGGRIGARGGYDLAAPPLFLLSQLVLLFPTVGVVLLVALWPRSGRDGATDHRQLLRWLVVPQLVVFLLLAGRMQVLSSWLVPAWWLLLPLAGDWLAGPHDRRWRRWIVGGTWGTALILPALLLTLALQVRWGVLDAWLPPGLDTSTELMPADSLRRDLRRNPVVWKALQEASLIAGNRYDLPGFLALALGSHLNADYTTFSNDSRGFAWWQPPNGYQGAHGVLFGIVEPGKPLLRDVWLPRLGKVEPLGTVEIHRAGRPALQLEFSRFGPLPRPWPRRYGPNAAPAEVP